MLSGYHVTIRFAFFASYIPWKDVKALYRGGEANVHEVYIPLYRLLQDIEELDPKLARRMPQDA